MQLILRLNFVFSILAILIIVACTPSKSTIANQDQYRFASYNVALYRKTPGQLGKDLATGKDQQIKNVAAVIQQVRPDVLALMEFDYDPSGKLLKDFQENYLAVKQEGQQAITYPYLLQFPSNTGVARSVDLNKDGKISLPNDAYGYGAYEGQYAFCLLSKYPFDTEKIQTYQTFLWPGLPNAKQVLMENGKPYYSHEALKGFRLSSKNHAVVPIKFSNGNTIHTILAHPTPPVFDGPEDRNGLRNYDEIRLIKEIISGSKFLIDDQGRKGGLKNEDHFVILGDLNADPIDGDSAPGAINQLLNSQLVNPATATGDLIPSSNGGKEHNKSSGDKGDPAHDTSFFGKRIDYVLISKKLKALASGVFWPGSKESLYDIVKDKMASDHLLVWADVSFD